MLTPHDLQPAFLCPEVINGVYIDFVQDSIRGARTFLCSVFLQTKVMSAVHRQRGTTVCTLVSQKVSQKYSSRQGFLGWRYKNESHKIHREASLFVVIASTTSTVYRFESILVGCMSPTTHSSSSSYCSSYNTDSTGIQAVCIRKFPQVECLQPVPGTSCMFCMWSNKFKERENVYVPNIESKCLLCICSLLSA